MFRSPSTRDHLVDKTSRRGGHCREVPLWHLHIELSDTLNPRQNCHHFANIVKCISLDENHSLFSSFREIWSPINKLALAYLVAWHRTPSLHWNCQKPNRYTLKSNTKEKECQRNASQWGRDKIAAISQISQIHFLEWNVCISLNISLKFVPNLRINNIPALVQFTNAYMRHSASMS